MEVRMEKADVKELLRNILAVSLFGRQYKRYF